MTAEKKKNLKIRVLFHSFIFSLILLIFPVASGAIVMINGLDILAGYWLQGAFMLLSIAVPAIVILRKKITVGQIGFSGIEKGSLKTVAYFIPALAAKIGFLLCGINNNIDTMIALAFFTTAIGLSEEIYFRGIILRWLMTHFPVRQAVMLSCVFFSAAHAAQAFSGEGLLMVLLTILNAFIFGIVAAEIVIITDSLIPVIIWHAFYDFINWTTLVAGVAEVVLIIIESAIMILYAAYLWTKLPSGHAGGNNVYSMDKEVLQ